ncbi:MAG TPA: DEAD/DEAH box helicase family protein [Capsulimonadaceae bacterium]
MEQRTTNTASDPGYRLPTSITGPVTDRSIPARPSSGPELREWQLDATDALVRVRTAGGTNFMACACPGAGKTTFALSVCKSMLRSGEAQRIVVVVPSCHLKKQWAAAAQRLGIRLTANWGNDSAVPEQADVQGIIVTYAQVASLPEASRIHCSRRRTVLVADEIHHAGQGLSWGDALRDAFEHAVFRILLSGTPFRSDDSTIPFVQYENGRSVSDYSYGYGEALRDSVCRPIVFPSFEGQMEWMENDETVTATFGDDIDDERMSRRLRTALDAEGDWLRDVVRAADRKVTEIRSSGHPNAGGLIVAMDQRHAQQIAEVVRSVTREAPAIATCDDPEASAVINEYAESDARWLVSVRMVSEGCDIPRLRVGVYATTIQSELFIRQWIGRFVRVVPGLEDEQQFGYCYVPADGRILSVVHAIQQERDHVIGRSRLQDRERGEGNESTENEGAGHRGGVLFIPMSASAVEGPVYADGQSYSPEIIAQARDVKQRGSAMLRNVSEVTIAELLRLTLQETMESPHADLPDTDDPVGRVPDSFRRARTFDEENAELRQTVTRLSNAVARTLQVTPDVIHRAWRQQSGVPQRSATNAQIRDKIQWLRDLQAGRERLGREVAVR